VTRKLAAVIVIVVAFTALLSGCKLPASKGPADTDEELRTTPIVIQTDSPMLITQTEVAKIISTVTLTAPTATATPEPTEVIIIPTMTVPEEYTVHEGELVYCLGRRFDVDPDDLISLNNLTADGALDIGDVLQIPSSGSWDLGPRRLMDHPTTYTVEEGDTIYNLACMFGDLYPEEIIAANRLEEPYELTVGDVINIP
jgi:LysM repeat protein